MKGKLCAILTVFALFIFFKNYAQCITFTPYTYVYIHENVVNSVSKVGYNLIFDDEFDTPPLNTVNWAVSDYNDDGYLHCQRGLIMNPANVVANMGSCRLRLTDNNYHGCTGSAGEIRTATGFPASGFFNWNLIPGSYLEARVKNLPMKNGLGSAFWLFGANHCNSPEYREIDVWETNPGKPNAIKSNYHWQTNICVDENISSSMWAYLKDLDIAGNPDLNLNNGQWYTFGVYWDLTKIEYYINNVLYRTITIDDEAPPVMPMMIRLGTQTDFYPNDDCAPSFVSADMPQNMDVDYIRVYIKDGIAASPWVLKPIHFCSSWGTLASVQYYPGATYSCPPSAYLNSVLSMGGLPCEFWISKISGAATNTSYPISIMTTFPDGRTETQTTSVYVDDNISAIPARYPTVQRIGSSCYYQFRYLKDHAWEKTQWSISGGSYTYGTESGLYSYYGVFDGDGSNYAVKIKRDNSCSVSYATATSNLNVPIAPAGCVWRLTDTSGVTTIQNFLANEGEKLDINLINGANIEINGNDGIDMSNCELIVSDILGRILYSDNSIFDGKTIDASNYKNTLILFTIIDKSTGVKIHRKFLITE